jgi:large subunit ribosomal protein L35
MGRKLKTKKAFTKRMKVTKKGKVLRSKAGRRHLMSHRSEGRKRGLRKKTLVAGVDIGFVRKGLPYGF